MRRASVMAEQSQELIGSEESELRFTSPNGIIVHIQSDQTMLYFQYKSTVLLVYFVFIALNQVFCKRCTIAISSLISQLHFGS